MADKYSPITLVMQTGPATGQVYPVTDRPQTIGRGSTNDIVIPDKSLSRLHARIRATPAGFIIEDLGSTNGTFVNERQVFNPMPLHPGDTIRLGTTITLRVQGRGGAFDADKTVMSAEAGRPAAAGAAVTRGAAPLPAQPQRRGTGVWMWVILVIILVALLVGGGLGFLYYTRLSEGPAPTAAAQLPTPLPTEELLPTPTETPTLAPSPSPTPTPTPKPLQVPGVAAGAMRELRPPSEITNLLNPFCNREMEIKAAGEPVYIIWEQPLARAANNIDFVANWLDAAHYKVTLDGRPISDLNVYRDDGPTLQFWHNLGLLSPGRYYVSIEQFTNREISTGLDIEPADGQLDTFGPGPAGEGFCELVVPEPVAVATNTPPPSPTPTATPKPATTPTPTATAAQAQAGPAPVGVFQDFETPSVWKRGDEPYGEFSRTSAQVHSGSYAGQLSYNFPTPNNDYVVFLHNRLLAGQPSAISAWVYGDGSGHFLNLWLKDANGQRWSMSFGQIKHTGWQEMTAYLDPGQPWPSGHISGPNNNAIDYPISFEALVLDDGSDSYTGRGAIYIDDLTSRVVVTPPTPAPQVGVTPSPGISPGTGSGLYVLGVGKHLYEPWGAPRGGDICQSYRDHNFDDKIHMKGLNLELLLTNNSTIPVPDEWVPDFITAKGKSVQVCYYGYAGSGPKPGATSSMTFFTIVEPDDYVRVVQLNVNGQFIQICLGPSGAPAPC